MIFENTEIIIDETKLGHLLFKDILDGKSVVISKRGGKDLLDSIQGQFTWFKVNLCCKGYDVREYKLIKEDDGRGNLLIYIGVFEDQEIEIKTLSGVNVSIMFSEMQ